MPKLDYGAHFLKHKKGNFVRDVLKFSEDESTELKYIQFMQQWSEKGSTNAQKNNESKRMAKSGRKRYHARRSNCRAESANL